jgi:hypothetical protein
MQPHFELFGLDVPDGHNQVWQSSCPERNGKIGFADVANVHKVFI